MAPDSHIGQITADYRLRLYDVLKGDTVFTGKNKISFCKQGIAVFKVKIRQKLRKQQ